MNIIERRRRYIGGLPTGYSNTGALTVDGTNDYLQLPYTPQAALRNSFTIGAWIQGANINPGAPHGNLKYIFGAYKTFNVWFVLFIDGPGKIGIIFEAGSGANLSARTDTTPYSGGTTGDSGSDWEHIGAVITEGASSGDATSVKIYRNGSELAATATATTMDSSEQSAIDFSSGSYSAIGAYKFAASDSSYSGPINANIDEVAMWTTALDADAMAVVGNTSDIKDLTEDSGNYDNSSDLEFYYKLNEGTGTSAADFSGNGNTATLINGATWTTGASN